MLLAPRADLLAEGETGELTAAFNAVCHGLLKEYQQFGRRRKPLTQVSQRDTG
jgi:hypothetical protein